MNIFMHISVRGKWKADVFDVQVLYAMIVLFEEGNIERETVWVYFCDHRVHQGHGLWCRMNDKPVLWHDALRHVKYALHFSSGILQWSFFCRQRGQISL